MTTNKNSKEIEYGVKVKNGDELITYLNEHAVSKGSIKTLREVYKKEDSNYFFRTDFQEIENKESYRFSVKEDLLGKQGIDSGMKVSEEVDIDVSQEQLDKLKQVVILLGYSLITTIPKIRRIYEIEGLIVTLDTYSDTDYLEVEGESKEKVMDLVSKLPIIKYV